MATLSSLPNELLLSIFAYAAADVSTGTITTTLGRVCWSFYRLIQSSGIDVMHVSLRGFNSMIAFFRLLESRDISRSRVFSLLIVMSRNSTVDTDLEIHAVICIQAILSNIDPSYLETLFIYLPLANLSTSEATTLQLPVPLPALTDLYLSGLVAISPAGLPPYAPSLQRVQLLRILALPDAHSDIAGLLHNLAPNILQFKLSIRLPTSAAGMDSLVTHFLQYILANYPKPEDRRHSSTLPGSLAQVAVQFDLPEERVPDRCMQWLERLGNVTERLSSGPRWMIFAMLPHLRTCGVTDRQAGQTCASEEEFAKVWAALVAGDEIDWA
ncbi:hypothetical protein EIP91_001707 [Steccherinum ochraceum]|uniref:Uncharacterized protein n=1 Tax=Steccherinum ochraceum TaxID=92696 RepID=A0A4R0RH85_9APHY|nr:hypothetical protein EIP91_001707 [Steccherinum ochraceum]